MHMHKYHCIHMHTSHIRMRSTCTHNIVWTCTVGSSVEGSEPPCLRYCNGRSFCSCTCRHNIHAQIVLCTCTVGSSVEGSEPPCLRYCNGQSFFSCTCRRTCLRRRRPTIGLGLCKSRSSPSTWQSAVSSRYVSSILYCFLEIRI
jgi:hypothetical protein